MDLINRSNQYINKISLEDHQKEYMETRIGNNSAMVKTYNYHAVYV